MTDPPYHSYHPIMNLKLNDVRGFHVKVPWSMERLDEEYNILCEHRKGL